MQIKLKPLHAAILGGLLLIGWPYLKHGIDWSVNPSTPSSPEAPVDAALVVRVQGAMVGPNAKADAAKLAGLYASLAETLAFDGKLQTPQIKSTDQLQRLQEVARAYALDGATFGEKYPAMVQIVGDALKAAVGDDVAPLDAPLRAKAVAAYRELAAALAKAA